MLPKPPICKAVKVIGMHPSNGPRFLDSPGQAEKCGCLMKKGGSGLHLVRTTGWHQRYFELHAGARLVFWYTSGGPKRGDVILDSVEPFGPQDELYLRKKWGFAAVSGNIRLLLYAETEEEKDTWVIAISRCLPDPFICRIQHEWSVVSPRQRTMNEAVLAQGFFSSSRSLPQLHHHNGGHEGDEEGGNEGRDEEGHEEGDEEGRSLKKQHLSFLSAKLTMCTPYSAAWRVPRGAF